MNSPECFYLHLAGAQQGPYTIPQIDHLLNSGLIGIETLYWCEGLDQWQPVTTLVPLRKKPKHWVKPAIAGAVMLFVAVIARLFGPVLMDGWHEANQHSFTDSAAYWRARDVVRSDLRTQGLFVEFAPFADSRVALERGEKARVSLSGSVIDGTGNSVRKRWDVPMQFNSESGEWSGGPPAETTVP